MIEVGEYVRTQCGIAKIKDVSIKNEVYDLDKDIMFIHEENWQKTCTSSQIIKHSKNIIDLIEEGDYVNGQEVVTVYGYDEDGNDKDEPGIIEIDDDYAYGVYLEDINILTIATREQIAQITYKVKE